MDCHMMHCQQVTIVELISSDHLLVYCCGKSLHVLHKNIVSVVKYFISLLLFVLYRLWELMG